MASEEYYNHGEVEDYWQYVWEDEGVFEVDEDAEDPVYVLGMFPYTSGNLHVGHVRNYAITDAYARFRRMQGEEVLHPMGWDAFGLPAEKAALERGTDPSFWTESCIDRMREEMRGMGFGYDWSREVTTCDPDYYRWTQWLFARLYDAGLIEYDSGKVNWCPQDETVLANEQVENGECWQCGTPVETRDLDQWFVRVTDYAEDLLAGLDDLDGWPDHVKTEQRNWIGRSEGATVEFDLADGDSIEAFTTRLDTLPGATFLAISPQHPLAREFAKDEERVREFVERSNGEGEGGVETGERAIHPLTGEELPVYVAEYVLEAVGTGAVMGVPAHDERDHDFARAHDIPIGQVIEPAPDSEVDPEDVDVEREAFTEDGVLATGDEYDGLSSAEARERFVEELDAEEQVDYRLEDWCVSRQRYWGTPIPIVHCPDCGPVLVPEEDLPVELPEFVEASGNPLDSVEEFVETSCPACGGEARRETDTMDTFVDSAWYYLRYLSPEHEEAPFETARANAWLPVDQYVGGDEHAVRHLLYIRFFARALADLDLLDHEEPIEDLLTQGMVLKEGSKMGKGGEVVTTEDYGADSLRLFVLEAAQPENDFDWSARRRNASYEFQKQVYRFVEGLPDYDTDRSRGDVEEFVEREIDAAIIAITDAYDELRFYDATREVRRLAARLQEYREHATPDERVLERGANVLVRLLAPITPHLCEELWLSLDEGLVAEAAWPEPIQRVPDYERERDLIEATRDDVRAIAEAIQGEPERIAIATAPEWKYRAYRIAENVEEDVYDAVLSEESVARHGEVAVEYAASLAERAQSLAPTLPPEREYESLRRAAWLIAKEFDADVEVMRAEDAPSDLRERAEPGKPGIDVT